MAERYGVTVKVVSQKGTCALGHKIGEQWVIKDKTAEGICLGALAAMIGDIRVLMYGGTFPWSEDPDTSLVACPDPVNPVVFEIRRIRK